MFRISLLVSELFSSTVVFVLEREESGGWRFPGKSQQCCCTGGILMDKSETFSFFGEIQCMQFARVSLLVVANLLTNVSFKLFWCELSTATQEVYNFHPPREEIHPLIR